MPIRALVYASQAVAALPRGQLDALVKDAVRFNTIAGVTGLLLFDGVLFLQYLEGPEDGLRAAYDRVLHASSHIDVMQLAAGRVGNRVSPYWPMTLIDSNKAELRRLAAADWNSFVRRGSGARATAVDYLDELITRHQGLGSPVG
ncbi:hypothetical protein CXF96_16000 [Stenotrophomonas sp. Betaine-02u-21]|uniref:BLUF domain-containing protein n=1 Tax=unclassified Stenotrophomonas TaxID=196198 RepID=UPI000C32553F|nr:MULTISPECIES: BLUF domain-containing protein [unclassified Stenotrophomonas]PKH70334.1 hypothetical protein CXF90_15055 [Stenotrophomonas sp. Betaine-02u-23]PKH72262.1 hypothetical protein CXF96_16000 [Stenotrophomonas sp. Betaine-02u-21]PKH96064.1 hypothetical protein CXG43_09280 [Stenotrophomonas sp. Bg11-02]